MSAPKPALQPLPRYVLPVLIVVLIGLIAATVKQTFWPAQPAAWQRLHEPGLTMEEVDKILIGSGALKSNVKTAIAAPTETWTYQHRTGSWSIYVKFGKTPPSSTYRTQHVLVHCDITNFPSCARTWNYPSVPPGAGKTPGSTDFALTPPALLLPPADPADPASPTPPNAPPTSVQDNSIKVHVGIK